LRRLVLKFLEILIELFPFFFRWKLSVTFPKLPEACAVNQNHSRNVDFFRLQLPLRVQTPILITLHAGVTITRF
jgi:hypothetical protein